jgi:ankyrin repeat protein
MFAARDRPVIDVPEDRCERAGLSRAIHEAFAAGDFEALGRVLGGAPRWFDERMPFELGLGHPLEHAIYWSPYELVERLLGAGSSANYADDNGFPSLFAALSCDRPDRQGLIALLLAHGADPDQRGINDWTALHYAVCRRDAAALELLLSAGADPALRTRIDDCDTPLEAARRGGFEAGIRLLEASAANRPADRR